MRAVDALNFNYVNKIDYRDMAVKGIRRCRSLAEVVKTLTVLPDSNSVGISRADSSVSRLGESFKDFKPDANMITMLCLELGNLEQEVNGWPEGAGKERFIASLDRVLELNARSAKLPVESIIANFVEASFGSLDPYTVLVWPVQAPEFEQAMTNEFSGIGIQITKEKGQLTVESLLPDTPAYNSGLDAGDVIESVDGNSVKDMPLGCAVKHILGPSGTKVTLTIKREGELQPRDITITRAKIIVQTLCGWQRNSEGKWLYMVDEDNKIGYVRITSFGEKTASELKEAIKTLEAEGMRGLILDLRFNSGGLYDSAIEVTDEFLDDGLIVISRPRFGMPTYASATGKGKHSKYPMVVLTNSGSASASEIVAVRLPTRRIGARHWLGSGRTARGWCRE